MILVVGYVRVSTIEQEQGFGREAQEARIRKYCQDQGLPAPEIVQESKSGESILGRHELKVIMARTKSVVELGGEAHVVFAVLDRLSRHLIDQESLYLQALRTRVRLHSTNPSENDTLDPTQADDPARTLIRQVFGVLNQFERSVIRQRLDSGKEQKSNQGGWCGGRIPYGFRAENQDLVIHPREAAVVQMMFRYHQKGYTLRDIAAIMTVKTGEKWSFGRLQKIINNEERYHGHINTHYRGQMAQRPDLAILDQPAGSFGEVCVKNHKKALTALLDMDPKQYGKQVSMPALAEITGLPEDVCMGIAVRHGVPLKYSKPKSNHLIESQHLTDYYRAFQKTAGDGLDEQELTGAAVEYRDPTTLYGELEKQFKQHNTDHLPAGVVDLDAIHRKAGAEQGSRPVVPGECIPRQETAREGREEGTIQDLEKDISSLDKDLEL